MKGRIYEKDWTRDSELDRAASNANAGTKNRASRIDEVRAAEARNRLEAIIDRRADWVRERYPDTAERSAREDQVQKKNDPDRSGRDQREAEALDRDQRSDSSSDRVTGVERTDDLDGVEAQSRERRAQRERSVSDPSADVGAGLALWRKALRKIGGLNDREFDGDRASALGRIREIGSRVRGFGAKAIAAVRSLLGRDERPVDQTEQARDAFASSERSLGAAEQINHRLDREGASIARQVEMSIQIEQLQRELERTRQQQLTR